MHFLKKGQKIRAWVDPPPPHSGNAWKKSFFFIEAFPKISALFTQHKVIIELARRYAIFLCSLDVEI